MLPHQLVNLGNFDIRPFCLKDDEQDVVRLGERLAAVSTPNTTEAAPNIVSALDPD